MEKRRYSDKEAIAANQCKKEREYWLQKLEGELVKSSFPYDYTVENTTEIVESEFKQLNSLQFKLDGNLFDLSVKISGGADVRIQMIFAAAMMVLLSKYTGNRDIIIGSPILKQKENVEFINTVLIFRDFVDKDVSFKQLLLQLKNTIMEAAEHQNFPMKVLPDLLKIPNIGTGFPLFDTALVLENIQDKKYMEDYFYSMLFSFLKECDHFRLDMHYNPSRYSAATVRQIVRHLKCLLESALRDVNQSVDLIDILGEDERKKLLETFNGKSVSFQTDQTFHQLFEEQALRTPDNIAVIGKSFESVAPGTLPETGNEVMRLTYSQLNQRAELLALKLQEQGVSPDSVVAVMAERCPAMVVGAIAVLKAGGAYLPIDPQYPPERIKFMLNDSRTSILVVQPQMEELAGFDGTVINIDAEYDNSRSTGPLNEVVDSTNLAYVIYTSGSTGMPKGVMVQHNHWINVAGGWRLEYRLHEMEINLLQMASFSFDVFAGDMARTLLNGGKMVINSEAAVAPEVLYQLISDYRISLFESTPSYIIPFMNFVYENHLPIDHLELLILGSDTCPAADFKQLLNRFGSQMRIVNSYGVTESTIDSSFYEEPDSKNVNSYGSIPIGKPLPNMTFYILDSETGSRLLPLGVTGELYIGGKSVARGYLYREELTSQRFLPDPFNPDPKSRMYKTGDLARWLPDGNVEFIGRSDFQVKVRGYRIELGEIENRLLEHENIREVVVLARDDEGGNKYLCAYFVPNVSDRNQIPDKQQFREYLANTLPDYMIPWFFTALEKMPLTPNGKIDRKAMPEPDVMELAEYVAPRNEMEKELVRIFSEVLSSDIDSIGIDSTFFDLGGNSLKAIILISKIHKQFDVKLELTDIFEKQTIRILTQFISQSEKVEFHNIRKAFEKEDYVLSPAQRRFFLMQMQNPGTTSYNMSHSVFLKSEIDKEKIEEAFIQLIQRHESLRTAFIIEHDEPVQKIMKNVDFHIHYFPRPSDNRKLSDLLKNFSKPFDLSSPPLLRVGIIDYSENVLFLIVDTHHIISDGVSQSILIEEFSDFYAGRELTPLKLQYKDYSEWLNSQQMSEVLRQQEEYWIKRFEDNIPVLNLPLDYKRPSVQSTESSILLFTISMEQMQSLRKLAMDCNITLFILLLAIYNIVLAKLCDQEDVIVGSVVTGRNHPDLERVIGVFVNLLPMRSQPVGEKKFLEYLSEVNNDTLAAFKNQDYAFDDLVEKIVNKRDPSRHPILDVGFVLQNLSVKSSKVLDIDPVDSDSSPISVENAKLDINLEAVESKEQILFKLQYRTKLFKEKTIRNLGSYYCTLIASIIESPDRRIRDISLISFDQAEKIRSNILQAREEIQADFDL